MASRRIHMRKNLDPNPPEVVLYLEKILWKGKDNLKLGTIPLERAFSLP
jgi:hypothetical protein